MTPQRGITWAPEKKKTNVTIDGLHTLISIFNHPNRRLLRLAGNMYSPELFIYIFLGIIYFAF